jgi:hypothetical protein
MSKSKSKSKGKRKAKPAVRGPQKELPFGGRTPRLRLRFVEPGKPDGNPFFALRVPAELLNAFKREAGKRKTSATAMVRAYMSKVTGVAVDEEPDGE